MQNKIFLPNFGQKLTVLNSQPDKDTGNTNLLKQQAAPDTVEIAGEVKTAQTAENKKKKMSKKKKALIAAGVIGTAAVIAAGMSSLKRGKLPFGRSKIPFSHEPLIQNFPTAADLDKAVAETIKDVKLDYGFSENITKAQDIKTELEKYCGDWRWGLGTLAANAEKDEGLRYALRVLTGKNFTEYGKEAKVNLDGYHITSIAENLPANIDKSKFQDFMKFIIKASDEKQITAWNRQSVLSDYKGDYADASRFFALCKNINEQLSLKGWGSLNGAEILSGNPNLNFNQFNDFLKILKKGSVTDPYLGNVTLAGFNDVFKNKDISIKTLSNLYKSMNDKVIEHVSLATLKDMMTASDIDAYAAIKKLNSLPDDVISKFEGSGDAITYIRFEKYLGKNNINELNQAEKRELMNKLIQNNAYSFNSYSDLFKLIPKNQKEYCNLLNKLAKSIGISTKPLTAAEKKFFEEGMARLDRSIKDVDFNNVEISLKISREDFVNKALDKMKKLDELEQRKVMDYFGFEIEKGKLKGYPINLNNGEKLAEIPDKKTKKVIEELRPFVVDFSEHNPITVTGASKSFEKDLNDILGGLPELRSIIGRKQHVTHSYTLDKHTLKVLQGVVSNPKFANLSAEDKKILSIASLLHDITKAEGLRDFTHPMESAFDAFYIIQKMNLPEEQQLKIYELIKSHNWLDRMNHPKNTADDIQRIAQDIAFDARHTNTFELAKILCEADMKAVKKDDSFFKHHKKTLNEMSAIVDNYIKKIHETQIVLPQTIIPKASQIKNGVEKSAGGIKNTVIYMNKADENLEKYGFAPGTTKDNWRAIVHALDNEDQMQKFNTFSIIDTEALLSTSYIDTKSYKVFRKQGFILDVNTNDIHAGYSSDFGTGYAKTIELLKSDYLFYGMRKGDKISKDAWRNNRTEYRRYISDLIKQKMNITDSEYVELLEKIQGCKSLTDIEKVDKNFAQKLKETFAEMESRKRRGNRQYNEMLVTRPKIQAVFAYDKSYEKIPEFLRKYAADNDLPIIIFG